MPASLFSIKIRGIRSFSPYQHKAQTLEFTPLTLIVGSNGSGKTTLIESLKFIISGDEPPLSDCRRNFIHTTKNSDKSFDKNISYASIELRFQNAKNEMCIAKREISKTGTGKNPIPSISSSYKIQNRAWNFVHKQDDWNRTIPRLFNLPNQAILNNVVLCHQDQNLWCMSDSSTVKQIFDRIFSCEQYKKEIKYMDAEIKACKSDLALATKDLAHRKEKVEYLKRLNSKSRSSKADSDKLSFQIKAYDSKIKESQGSQATLVEKIRKIESNLKNIEYLKQRASEISDRTSSLRESLGDAYLDPQKVTDIELERNLVEYTALVDQKRKRQTQLKNNEESLRTNIKKLDKDKSTLHDMINEVKVVELKSRETHDCLVKKLEQIKLEYPLESVDCFDISDMKSTLDILELYEKSLSQNKCEQSELEDKLSSKQQKLAKNLSNLEGTYQGLLHKIKNKETFVKKLSEQLAQADPMAKDLIFVLKNLDEMSSLTNQISPCEQVDMLKNLIKDSSGVLDKIVVKIQKDSISKLNVEIEKENQEIESSKSQVLNMDDQKTELKNQQDQLESDYNKVKTASKEAHKKVVLFQNARLNIVSAFEKYQNEKNIIETKNVNSKIEELQKIEGLIESSGEELTSLSVEYSKLTDEIGQSFSKFEEFKNNKSIRDFYKTLNFIKEEIFTAEQGTPSESELRNLQLKLKELEQREIELREKRSMDFGSKNEMDREIARLKEELKNYSNANSKYAESLGKVVCNEIIISDLEKLKECFQQSIIKFHNEMIIKINEVLRARWRQIYKGNDIDHIELVDEEVVKGNDKKVFNYYIAMRKGGVRMKMREKSSAGQKALASIILRMALAELFVKDFAFIALDEPTANLDLANVQSLARAIGSYVRRRNNQGANIQWIIITHDEQFLKALDSECSPYYYRIQLDQEGCSKITKISFQDAPTSSVQSSSSGTQES